MPSTLDQLESEEKGRCSASSILIPPLRQWGSEWSRLMGELRKFQGARQCQNISSSSVSEERADIRVEMPPRTSSTWFTSYNTSHLSGKGQITHYNTSESWHRHTDWPSLGISGSHVSVFPGFPDSRPAHLHPAHVFCHFFYTVWQFGIIPIKSKMLLHLVSWDERNFGHSVFHKRVKISLKYFQFFSLQYSVKNI